MVIVLYISRRFLHGKISVLFVSKIKDREGSWHLTYSHRPSTQNVVPMINEWVCLEEEEGWCVFGWGLMTVCPLPWLYPPLKNLAKYQYFVEFWVYFLIKQILYFISMGLVHRNEQTKFRFNQISTFSSIRCFTVWRLKGNLFSQKQLYSNFKNMILFPINPNLNLDLWKTEPWQNLEAR